MGALHARTPALGRLGTRISPAPALFALLVPLVFLHAQYQPSVSVAIAGSSATLYLSDVAVLAIGAVGAWSAWRDGLGPLRPGRLAFAGAAAFLMMVFVATLYGPALGDHYASAKHLLTALKLAEYGLLALAAPLVLRRIEDVRLPLWTLTLWSVAASVGAVLQFLGVVDELEGRRPGQREPSFVGIHDLAALSGATLSLGLLTIVLRREPRLGAVAGVAGAVGLGLSGAVAGVVGIAAAATAAVLYARPRPLRVLAVASIVAAVGACVIALRTVDTRPLLDALGVSHSEHVKRNDAEVSWNQRFALSYIGVRIFRDHPLIGVGFEGSEDAQHYRSYVDDARRKFPSVPQIAFPSPAHPWGVQNGYVQAAADMGILGLAAFASLFLFALFVAVRAARRSPPELRYVTAVPILWLLLTMGVWLGLGLVAGIPLVGLTSLAVGFAAAAPSWRAA